MGTVWLVKAEPYDPDVSSTVEVLWSLGSKTPKYDGKHWPAVLIEPPQTAARLFSKDDVFSGGDFRASAPIRVAIGEGDDEWRTYNWEGRSLTIYRGEEGDAFGSFVTVATTAIEEVRWTRSVFEVRLGNFLNRLRQPVAPSRYAGTGGAEGDASLKNKPKPRALGKVKAAEPVLVDEQALVYQVNDGEVGGIDAVYAAARQLTFKSDTSSLYQFAPVRQQVELSTYQANGSFSRNGLHYYTIDGGNVDHFALTRPFDWLTAQLRSSVALSAIVPGIISSGAFDVAISKDGDVLFIIAYGSSSGYVYGIPLNFDYQLSGFGTVASYDFTSQEPYRTAFSDFTGLRISDDGTKLLFMRTGGVVGIPSPPSSSHVIFQFEMSTSLDVSTMSYTAGDFVRPVSFGSYVGSYTPFAFDLSPDELTMFIHWQDTNTAADSGITEVSLSAASDITGSNTFVTQDRFIPRSVVRPSGGFTVVTNASGDMTGFLFGSLPTQSGAVAGIVEIRLPSGDTADGVTGVVKANEYVTNEGDGTLMVSAVPSGVIHVDLSTSGGDLDTSILYSTPGAIIEQLLLQELDAGDLDSASFTQIETDIDDEIGYYIGTESKTIAEVIVDIASSVGAAIRPSVDGKIGIVQVKIGTPAATINESDIIAGSFRRLEAPDRVWKARVGYEYNWRPLLDSEIDVERAASADIQRLRVEQREESSETSSIRTESLAARERSFTGYYASSADASTEAARRVTLAGAKRDIYQFKLKGQQFTRQVGETITLVHPDTRTPAGLDCIVVAVEERRDAETEIEVWG